MCEWPAQSVQKVCGHQTAYVRSIFTELKFAFSAV